MLLLFSSLKTLKTDVQKNLSLISVDFMTNPIYLI